MSEIGFSDLTQADFPRLQDWLNRPHLRRFFQKTPISLDEVRERYDPRLSGDTRSRCHLAHRGGAPFGYLQCYRIADFPEWGEMIGEPSGIGVDLYITEPGLIGQGLGKAMLAGYLREVAFPLFPAETTVWIAHESANAPAQACSRAVGFTFVRNFLENGLPTDLYRLDKDR